jgi:ferritin-like metal-binding protein YciE
MEAAAPRAAPGPAAASSSRAADESGGRGRRDRDQKTPAPPALFDEEVAMASSSKSFDDLFMDELKDIYDAEKRITRALPRMVKAVESEELSAALQEHLDVTHEQIARLDRVFRDLNTSPGRRTCEGMRGLLEEGEGMLDSSDDPASNDAAIIAAAQKVEHYEIATYGTLRDWARQLGHQDVSSMLQQTLDEEKEADRRLTEISNHLNLQAAGSGGGDEE